VDASLKDGYAVRAEDITDATPEHPIRLKLSGASSDGMNNGSVLKPGSAFRICTVARTPRGSNAVVSEEFTINQGDHVSVIRYTEPGRNILASGLPRIFVKLSKPVQGRQADWTEFVFGRFEEKEDGTFFQPLEIPSRLQAVANAEGIIAILEGVDQIPSGACIPAQLLI